MDDLKTLSTLQEALHLAQFCSERSKAGLKRIASMPEGETKAHIAAMLKSDAETAEADITRIQAALSRLSE